MIRTLCKRPRALSWKNEIEERLEARRSYLKNQCSRSGLNGPKHSAYPWEFLINRQYHIIWCNVFKAASTSWLYNFNLMANYTSAFLDNTTKVPVELARRRYPRPTLGLVKKAQKDSITFMIVRHPLERLASAYADKMVYQARRSCYFSMKKNIILKYRKKSVDETIDVREKMLNRRIRDIKWKSHRARHRLMQILGRQTKNMKFIRMENLKKQIKTSTIAPNAYPLFEEFVSYVLDEAKAGHTLDMHWIPYTNFCTPCKIKFDVILKFESLDKEQKYLIKLADLKGVVRAEWKNKGKTDANYIRNLYSRISRQQLDDLYQLYKYDFQLFNYSIDKYYAIVDRHKDNTYFTNDLINNIKFNRNTDRPIIKATLL